VVTFNFCKGEISGKAKNFQINKRFLGYSGYLGAPLNNIITPVGRIEPDHTITTYLSGTGS
jgi:hypothetical protein